MFGASVVALGNFNPPIISPDWLERHDLIGRDDADVARQSPTFLISHQVSQFETQWCSVQVVPNQFSATSKSALTEQIKDLVASIFTLLPQTPIDAIGLNFFGHFKMVNEEDYHKIGDCFAPKEIWNSIFPADRFNTGLQDLQMRVQPFKRGDLPQSNDHKSITLQPSAQIRGGVYLQLNDNRDLTKSAALDGKTAAERAAVIVDQEWNQTREQAENVFDELITRALASTLQR